MRTKIIATIGPASSSPEVLSKLIQAGVRIFRLNFSHGDASMFVELIDNIRKQEMKHNIPITIMQDLSGPKVRIGNLDVPSITFSAGSKAYLGLKKPENADLPFMPFDNHMMLADLDVKDHIVLSDGGLQFDVVKKINNELVVLQANNSGIVTSRKGLAMPGKSFKVPALTEKDKKDLADGLRLGVDAVALSFVQTPEDILEAKAIIISHGRKVPVVAKLERQNAVDRLDEILAVTDVVMVARGDLGIECPLPKLPTMQKRIIAACNRAAKPVIVATQMLLSMVNNPVPTRAETTDVANAVIDGADCVMLSEETAMGAYPVEAVKFMAQITEEAEAVLHERQPVSNVSREHLLFKKHYTAAQKEATPSEFLTLAACQLAEVSHARALVCHSVSGSSGRQTASYRPKQELYVLTPDHVSLKSLNFSWGVNPILVDENMPGHLERAEYFIDTNKEFSAGDRIVITAGQTNNVAANKGTNLVKIYAK
ncbi:pyruvate kinase [Desulfovibrio litoralis]|uniref:Pyruvate kinase n=1 Tax=Desulfovibrio litoralis DSM 11393 TaxID=1121455 RepID=A0A1M7TEI4_9BACT|nr:pyruvate kinase [Desulfovibrio litoralis]SHN69135.1 pyruvate kinase [Desulfovibrio litoralis DSM 11393]